MPMRIITTHHADCAERQPLLLAKGNTGKGGAEQNYMISYVKRPEGMPPYEEEVPIDFVSLEHEGITNEVLLAIVKDRLEGFQAGEFPCQENEDALAGVNHALKYLHKRTMDRIGRGVENKAVE